MRPGWLALGLSPWCLLLASLEAGEVQKIRDVGPDDNRIVIVIVAEGYLASQQADFDADAQRALDGLLTVPPYSQYSSFVNCYTDFVASNEEGADKPADCYATEVMRDTAFDATYCTRNIQRLLTVNSAAVFGMVNADVPSRDLIAVVVNDGEYGGAGGGLLTFSVNPGAMIELFAHEAGHTFGRLADEYEGDPGVGSSAPERNVTVETEAALIDWSEWIEPSTPLPTAPGSPEVGAFEGARYFSQGIYRPVDNCKMRTLNRPFGEVCIEAHVQRFYSFVSPIDEVRPVEAELNLSSCDGPLVFELLGPRPTPDTVTTSWWLDGELLVGEVRPVFDLDPSSLSEGLHELRAELLDETAFVRDAFLGPMAAGFTWTLQVSAGQATPVEASGLMLSALGAGSAELEWLDGGAGVDGSQGILSGRLEELHADADFSRACALREVSETEWVDASSPGPVGFYYLVESIKPCGAARLGGGFGQSRPLAQDRRSGLSWDGLPACPPR